MTSSVRYRRIFTALALAGIALVARSAPVVAVEPTFDERGLVALDVGGVNVLKPSPPHVVATVFEQTGHDDSGMKKYTFTRSAEAGKRAFSPATKVYTEDFSWGSCRIAYATPAKDRLDLAVTIANTSPHTLADFELALAAFAFPVEPKGWKGGKGPTVRSLDNLAAIGVEADPVRFLVASATIDPPLTLGFGPASEPGKFTYSFTVRGGVAATEPNAYVLEPHGRPRIASGQSLTFTITMRASPAGAKTTEVLPDVVEAFRAFHAPALKWDDRRPIAMIAHSSPAKQHQSATNPRGWLNNPRLDVVSAAGKAQFRSVMLKAAADSVRIIKDTGGQGMIFWDVEGEQHPITYIGDPSLAKKLAPEMDEIADDYFKVYRDAGLRTGVTLRPSQVYFNDQKKQWDHGTGSDGGPGRGDFYPSLRPKDVPWWRFYPIAERLCDKIAYAKKRWGCTLFYIDTNGIYRQTGEDQKFAWFLLEAQVWKRVREVHPDVLLIPELPRDDQTYHAAYAAYTAAYTETKMKGYRTPPAVRELFPSAFSIVNVGDGDLASHRAEIKAGVEQGDILMFRGWFGDQRNAWVKSLYAEVQREKMSK